MDVDNGVYICVIVNGELIYLIRLFINFCYRKGNLILLFIIYYFLYQYLLFVFKVYIFG